MVIDINLDDGLLDGMAAMQKFCKIAVTEPDVSKVRKDIQDGKGGYMLQQFSIAPPKALPSVFLQAI